MNHKQRIGRWGEEEGEKFLVRKGLKPLGKNIRTPYGEIDLLMLDCMTLVFIEVKARTNDRFGMPEEAITPAKRSHMISAAESYLQGQETQPEAWRIDVVSVRGEPGDVIPEILWFENAVS